MHKRIFTLLYLILLCVLLFCYGWMFKQTEILEEHRNELRQELLQLQERNAELKEQLKTLQEEKTAVFEQLQQWSAVSSPSEYDCPSGNPDASSDAKRVTGIAGIDDSDD